MLKRGWPSPLNKSKPSPIARACAHVLYPRDDQRQIKKPLALSQFQQRRQAALLRDDGLAKFMEYQRSRQRIARDRTLNLLLVLPIGIWFLVDTVDAGFSVVATFVVAGLVGIVVSGRAAERLRDAYEGI
jgi:hypothetical protein